MKLGMTPGYSGRRISGIKAGTAIMQIPARNHMSNGGSGMRFEELTAGRIITAGPRAVTTEEIVDFARRYDPQPFHVDPVAAASSRWGGLIASGWMTCGIAMELAARAILAGSTSIGSPGINELKWLHPVRPGDALTLTVTVLESRISRSGTGVVRWRWDLHNQNAVQVMTLEAVSLFEAPAGI